MEWSGNYAPEGAEFLYLDTVLLFVMYTTIINKIQKIQIKAITLQDEHAFSAPRLEIV